MENTVEELTESAQQGVDKLRRQSDRWMREGRGVWNDAKAWMRRSPMEAAGIALAAGAVVGGMIAALSARRYSRPSDSLSHQLASIGSEGLKPLRSAADRGLGALCAALEDIRTSLKR